MQELEFFKPKEQKGEKRGVQRTKEESDEIEWQILRQINISNLSDVLDHMNPKNRREVIKEIEKRVKNPYRHNTDHEDRGVGAFQGTRRRTRDMIISDNLNLKGPLRTQARNKKKEDWDKEKKKELLGIIMKVLDEELQLKSKEKEKDEKPEKDAKEKKRNLRIF